VVLGKEREMIDKFGEQCDHGQLKRSCELCELQEEIENLRQQREHEIEAKNKTIIKLQTERDDLRKQLKELGKAIVECAVVAGIVDGKMSLTGPQIILLAEDIKSLILSTRQQLAEKGKRAIKVYSRKEQYLLDVIGVERRRVKELESENAELRKKGKGIEQLYKKWKDQDGCISVIGWRTREYIQDTAKAIKQFVEVE
jgi:cell division protein FtsB